MTRTPNAPPVSAYLHLLVVYVVWGSTYLAIRIAVREGSGFPPFFMAASRVLAGGAIMLLWAWFRGSRIRPTRDEFLVLVSSAILLWVGGNGCVVWAEQRADSVYAAILVGALPLWVALFESILDRRAPSAKMTAALLIGFLGIAVISAPELQNAERADVAAIVALLIAPMSWGIGSIIQQRRPVAVSPAVSAGYQQVLAFVIFLALGLGFGEPLPHPTPEAWWGWSYLVVFGSVLAFTSFVKALRVLPTKILMTYAYVNPVIAAFLGWWILNEEITLWTFSGTTLVIAGVAGVFHEKFQEAGHATTASR